MRSHLAFGLPLVVLMSVSCGGCWIGDGGYTYTLRGVAVDAASNQPLSDATIAIGEGGDLYDYGLTSADGSFELQYFTRLACGSTGIGPLVLIDGCDDPPLLERVSLQVVWAGSTSFLTVDLTPGQQATLDPNGRVIELGVLLFPLAPSNP